MDEQEKKAQAESYTESSIEVLEGLQPVRVRPGMYIGDTTSRGLLHLVWEIVDNAIDEIHDGGCNTINVTIFPDNSVQVEDNGRGIPTGIHQKTHISTVETVFTVLHAGGKFGHGGGYKATGGLHGVGASVVNALSTSFEVWTDHAGKHCYAKFGNGGAILEHLKELGPTEHTGTTIKFKADPTIFTETTVFDYNTIRDRLRQLAFLNKGVKIVLVDQRSNAHDTFCYEGGLKEYVKFLNTGKELVHPDVIYIEGNETIDADNTIEAEVAIQYNQEYGTTFYSFCNNILTQEGGTHEEGFRFAIGKVLNNYAHQKKYLKDNEEDPITNDDIREGLTAVISVRRSNPQFEGQTKTKLGNSDVRPVVNKIVSEQLERFLLENPDQAKQIIEKVMLARAGRLEARKSREMVRKTALGFSALPGKLADCSSKDATKCEIFIVEGNSAGGSAKSGRSREFQAILPLRGKIINAQKAARVRVLDNQEIGTMITAFGTNIGEDFDITKLRYHKIVIMTDADVDGAHIATLLLTFFYNFMRPLIEQGHVYIAMPPLYKVAQGKAIYYAYKEEEMTELRKKLEPNGKMAIQRYKGLGEMDASQLWETTMDPTTRILKQVHLEDITEADGIFDMLMGDQVEPRKNFILDNAKFVKNLDI